MSHSCKPCLVSNSSLLPWLHLYLNVTYQSLCLHRLTHTVIRDMTPKQRFADLLHSVAAVSGLGRVRFLTSHPKYALMLSLMMCAFYSMQKKYLFESIFYAVLLNNLCISIVCTIWILKGTCRNELFKRWPRTLTSPRVSTFHFKAETTQSCGTCEEGENFLCMVRSRRDIKSNIYLWWHAPT